MHRLTLAYTDKHMHARALANTDKRMHRHLHTLTFDKRMHAQTLAYTDKYMQAQAFANIDNYRVLDLEKTAQNKTHSVRNRLMFACYFQSLPPPPSRPLKTNTNCDLATYPDTESHWL